MKKIIIITGTPGVGKTTLSKHLAKKLKYHRLDLHEHYKEISSNYNRSKQCYDIDINKLKKLVKDQKENIIIDSHISHLIPKVDLCIILTCSNLKKLEKRLIKRKYSKKKVKENIQAEIFQECLLDAQKHKHIIFDEIKRTQFKEITTKVKKKMKS